MASLTVPIPPSQFKEFSPHQPLIELASGVDALYLSGRATLPNEFVGQLEVARFEAERSNAPVPFKLGQVEYQLKPHSWQKYRHCLDGPWGRIGFSNGGMLPAVRIQPRTEFIQGIGPRAVAQWFRDQIHDHCDMVHLSVSRLDLFADFQGWNLCGETRHEFLCRSKSSVTYEENDLFTGFNFGKRATKTATARLYDKTIRIQENGEHFWKMIWGSKFDPSQSVLRVEFELGGLLLRQFDLATPEAVLDATGALWAYLTHDWLTHRWPTADQTKTRWPVSPQWECVQRAVIGEESHGLNRMYLGKRQGGVTNIMPSLEGYLASFGAYAGASSLDEMLPHLRDALTQRERDTGTSLSERIDEKHRKFGLP